MLLDPRTSAALACAALLLATHVSAQKCQTVTDLASRSASGTVGNSHSQNGALSLDGRYLAFVSMATNLATVPVGPWQQVYRRDRVTGEVRLVSALAGRASGQGDSSFASISDDGRWVAFMSSAANLVPGDTNGETDIFVKDVACRSWRGAARPRATSRAASSSPATRS